MRVASVTLVAWTRPCAGLWWCRRRLLVGGPCAYVPESIRYCYALRGPPPVVLGWGGHCANIVMCSHGEVGLRRGLFTTELRKPARRSCLARAQGPAQGPKVLLRFWGVGGLEGVFGVWVGVLPCVSFSRFRSTPVGERRIYGLQRKTIDSEVSYEIRHLRRRRDFRIRSVPASRARVYGLPKENHRF